MVGEGSFSLAAKFEREESTIVLSGIQALVRLPMDQHRADRRAGLRTATLISGYRDSPLAGLDIQLTRATRLAAHDIRFIPGVNEELGATLVLGSQQANLFPRPRYDGVVGMWYGKAPGVDRTGDVFRHANFSGVGPHDGVLALAGDDASAKSSTIPSQSEAAFFDPLMPVLYPGNLQEILDYGRYGFELSRYSGLWVGFKIATEVAYGFGTAEVSPDRIRIVDPGFEPDGEPWSATRSIVLLPPDSLALERDVHLTRALQAEGVARTLVVSSQPERLRDATLAEGVEVWPRERLDEAQHLLRDIQGTSVLLYDQH